MTTLSDKDTHAILDRLAKANEAFRGFYPGDPHDRQPVHTVYGGAHLFKADLAKKLGGLALKALDEYAPNFASFAKALEMPGHETLPSSSADVDALTAALAVGDGHKHTVYEPAWLAYTVYQRVREKLGREPIEESRLDFEDGYGNRPDPEEDGHAASAAEEVAKGLAAKTLPPFIGFRIKSFTEECRVRAVRTLDIFLTSLAAKTGGEVPVPFVVTLPKVTIPEQVAALADLLDMLEERLGIKKGAVGIDIMIETPQSIIDAEGSNAVFKLVRAGRGRVRSAAYGTYDYTALVNITAAFQRHTHRAADFARHVMQVGLAQTGVMICDGSTTIMPIGPHRGTPEKPLTPQQQAENRAVVHSAWKLHYDNVRHSLSHGYYQGWDLNPAQLPIRYAAVYRFFLESLADASNRLNKFIDSAAKATLIGNTFDDAATGQGLLNFFLRGIACGAITEEEALATGITLDELRGRSFVKIVANRTKA